MKKIFLIFVLALFDSVVVFATCKNFVPRKFSCESVIYDIFNDKNILSEMVQGETNTNDDDVMEIGFFSKNLNEGVDFSVRIEFSGPQCDPINPKQSVDIHFKDGLGFSSVNEFVQNSGVTSLLVKSPNTSSYRIYVKCQ